MFNCPQDYLDNCNNAYIRCKDCVAGEGKTDLLLYSPIEGSVKDHPAYKKQKQEAQKERNERKKEKRPRSQLTRKSYYKEKQKKNDIIKQTQKSGAVFGDGDYSILNGEFQGDHKWRTKAKAFTLSHAEYEKGIRQGTDSWLITNKLNQTVVVLTQEAWVRLLELAKEGLKNR